MGEKSKVQKFQDWIALVSRSIKAFLAKILWPVTVLAITYLIYIGVSDYTMLLEYVKVLVWPCIVIVLIAYAGDELKFLVRSIIQIKIGNASILFDQQKDIKDISVIAEFKSKDKDVSLPATAPKSDEFRITDEETHALLTSYAANAAYEEIWSTIFGTQLEVLVRLLGNIDGLVAEDLEDLLAKHIRLSERKAYTDLPSFLQYLRTNILITYDEESKLYKLTNAGAYFIHYLTTQGLTHGNRVW